MNKETNVLYIFTHTATETLFTELSNTFKYSSSPDRILVAVLEARKELSKLVIVAGACSPHLGVCANINSAMPHRVATFFRSHTNSFDLSTDLKKGPRRSSSSRPSISNRSPSSSGSSFHSEDHSVKMPGSKRLSLVGLHSPKSSSTKIPQHHNAALDMIIESPPLVFYGAATASSGALLSGQLIVNVNEDFVAFEDFKMKLAVEVTRKKPFHAHCEECAHQNTELQKWKFMEGPATLRRGELPRIHLVHFAVHANDLQANTHSPSASSYQATCLRP